MCRVGKGSVNILCKVWNWKSSLKKRYCGVKAKTRRAPLKSVRIFNSAMSTLQAYRIIVMNHWLRPAEYHLTFGAFIFHLCHKKAPPISNNTPFPIFHQFVSIVYQSFFGIHSFMTLNLFIFPFFLTKCILFVIEYKIRAHDKELLFHPIFLYMYLTF